MKPAGSAAQITRAEEFAARFGLACPILLAPMAGACPTALSIAVANGGGMGACGALLMQPDTIADWAKSFRAGSAGPFQINLWVPDPPPHRNAAHEAELRRFLAQWGPEPEAGAANSTPPDFTAQCAAVLDCAPAAASSIMGLFPADFVRRLKDRKIAWWANATTLAEARAAEAAGADVIVAQGMEAGGHRGSFDPSSAERQACGLFSLLPAIADAVHIPVVAAGGIADARGVAAALMLGASAVQIGTGFLRCPEAGIPQAWADALAHTPPEATQLTRAFSGRAGRSIATAYVRGASSPTAPIPAPYPVQRGLTQAMRDAASRAGDLDRMQAWSGQSAMLAKAEPAASILRALCHGLPDFLFASRPES